MFQSFPALSNLSFPPFSAEKATIAGAESGLTHFTLLAEITRIAVAGSVPGIASRVFRTGAVFPAVAPVSSLRAFPVARLAGKSGRTQAFSGHVIARKSGGAAAGGRAGGTEGADRTGWRRLEEGVQQPKVIR